MTPDFIVEILNQYGLPTALTIVFIALYKGQNDKQTKFLFKTISELNEREKQISELKNSIERSSALIDKLKNSIVDLSNTVKNCFIQKEKK